MGDLFFPIGIALVVLAVAVSALGLRNERFPSSRGALAGAIALFAVVVGATMTTAVINAKDEQETRQNEAADVASGEEELAKQGQQAKEVGQPQGANAQAALELSAPADGTLAFDPPSLEASAGKVEIDFTNPASIEHDVHVEQEGKDVAASDLVADDESTKVSAELEPGEYTYYCSVPGHREAGMEGTLTVD
jgi:plastocyanin